MPLEIMDQRGGTAGSNFCEDICSSAERQVGFWKLKSMPDHLVGTNAMGTAPGSEMVASSPLERHLLLNGTGSPHSIISRDLREKSAAIEGNSIMSKASLNSQDNFPKPWSTSSAQHLSYSLGKATNGINGSQWESSLFSSSFSDIFNRKVKLSGNDVLSQHTAKTVGGLCEEEEPFEASEEIEAKTIGNLLPTEDDLFAEVSNARATGGDDLEDFDLFSSGGGMELEGDDHLNHGLRNNGPAGRSLGRGNSDVPVVDGRAYSKHLSFYGGRQIAFSPGAIASSGMDNGAVQVLHSAIQGSKGAPIEPHRISSVRSNLVSPFSAVSASKQLGLLEPGLSRGQLKSANQCAPGLHPHSVPEYHDNLANSFAYNSPTLGGMLNHAGSRIIGGINNIHVRGPGSNGRLMGINEGVFGSPANGSSTQHGNRYLWTKSISDRHHPSSQMIWPNSPSFVRNVSPHHLSQIPGFTRPPVMLTPTPGHHVGSAPTVNPSMWDRRHSYSGESPDMASLHLGSLGNIGFLGRSASHPMEIATPNIFPRVAGSLVDMSKHAGVGSPQRMGGNFPGRNPMISVPTSFDSPNDRARSFSQRRVDSNSNSNSSDRKQYELDIDRIMRREDTRTTLMIKNIPNKYTSKMLLSAIDDYCRGTYDFIYLPIDFKNKCNVGYAFINMIDAQQIIPFHKAFNGKKWEKFNSEKVANLAYARIQGKSALVAHFQNSSLMNEDKRCRPILFRTDGPNAGDPEPFPVGPNIRPRPGKSRSGCDEEIHRQMNLSAVADVEDLGNGTDSSGSE